MTDIEWLKELVDERDRRYTVMDEANKAAVRAAFEAQEVLCWRTFGSKANS